MTSRRLLLCHWVNLKAFKKLVRQITSHHVTPRHVTPRHATYLFIIIMFYITALFSLYSGVPWIRVLFFFSFSFLFFWGGANTDVAVLLLLLHWIDNNR